MILACARNTALTAIGALLATACQANGGIRDGWSPGEIRLENPLGAIERIPVKLSDQSVRFGRLGSSSGLLALPDSGKRWWLGASGPGFSGTPVFDHDGEFVGAIWNTVHTGRGPAAVVPAHLLRETLEQAKRVEPLVQTAADERISAHPELVPGKCIGVLYLWGDSTAGRFGVVSLVEQNAALVLAHHVDSSTVGPRRLALCSAPMLSTVRVGAEDHLEMAAGDIVGAAVADNPFGVICVLGADPCGIEIRTAARAGAVRRSARHWLARDTVWLASGVTDSLAFTAASGRDATWNATVTLRDDANAVLDSIALDHVVLADVVRAIVERIESDVERVVSIDVALDRS